MSFELNICCDKNYWDNFVNNSTQGNIFSKTVFLDNLTVDYQLWTVMKNKEICLGAVMLKNKEGEFVDSADYFWMYQGLLLSQKLADCSNHGVVAEALKVTEFLLTELSAKYDRIFFSLHPNFYDLRSFSWFNYHEPELGQFKLNLRYTGLIDLGAYRDFEDYLGSIRTTRRYEYRKAIKDGFKAEKSQDVDTLVYLHRLTFERQGIKRTEKDDNVLKRIATSALSKGFGELLVSKNQKDEVISSTLYLFDDKYGYYLFGANHPDHRNAASGTLLMLENIRYCLERGIKWIDVCGINSPNRGDFKTSFNARPTPYFVVTWKRNG